MPELIPLILVLLLTLFSNPLTATQYDTDLSQRTLEGIQTVALDVSELNSHFKSYGLDKKILTKETVRQLQAGGLTVIPGKEFPLNKTAALIKLKVSDIQSGLGIISYSASLEMKEKIPLPRRENSFVATTIWRSGSHGIIRHHEAEKLRQVITTLIDLFIVEYHKQNQL